MERLTKRSEFVTLTKLGSRWVTPSFIVQMFQRNPDGTFRYGITASRKIGGAVQRNRAKRRLRALVREILPKVGKPGTDYVLIARQEALKRDFALMVKDIQWAVENLHKEV